MSHPLDRPVWTALATVHAHLAEGGPLARRYPPAVIPFAAAADDSPEAGEALAALVGRGDKVVLAEFRPPVLPRGLVAVSVSPAVQMVAFEPTPPVSDPRIERLMPGDAPEMLALATLTRPGPFTLGAMRLGAFWGVRLDGRIAAMAGVRMAQPGYTELSGVCVHPDFRSQGLARLLSLHVAGLIQANGATPYLHAYATNTAAIRLYESIGFTIRTRMTVTVARRAR